MKVSLGKLHDDVISRIESAHREREVVALAGRQLDNCEYGTILCNTEQSGPSYSREELSNYLHGISVKLGLVRDDRGKLLFYVAIYQLSLYNEVLLRLMHTRGVRAEGEEVYTGVPQTPKEASARLCSGR